jgi:hypothetical protein
MLSFAQPIPHIADIAKKEKNTTENSGKSQAVIC